MLQVRWAGGGWALAVLATSGAGSVWWPTAGAWAGNMASPPPRQTHFAQEGSRRGQRLIAELKLLAGVGCSVS